MPSEIVENILPHCVISPANFRLLFNLTKLDLLQREDPVLLFCHGGPRKN